MTVYIISIIARRHSLYLELFQQVTVTSTSLCHTGGAADRELSAEISLSGVKDVVIARTFVTICKQQYVFVCVCVCVCIASCLSLSPFLLVHVIIPWNIVN